MPEEDSRSRERERESDTSLCLKEDMKCADHIFTYPDAV